MNSSFITVPNEKKEREKTRQEIALTGCIAMFAVSSYELLTK